MPLERRKQLEALGHRIIPGREDPSGGGSNILNTILIDPKSGALWGAGIVSTW